MSAIRRSYDRWSVAIREFWAGSFLLPRIALCCAGAGVVVNLLTFAGLRMAGPFMALAIIHVTIVVLGIALFSRIGYHHYLALRTRGTGGDSSDFASPIPGRLIVAAVLAAIYFFALALAIFLVYGEGAPVIQDGREVWLYHGVAVRELAPGSVHHFESVMLRVFSAGWIFFGLLIALTGHKVEGRIRMYRDHLSRAAAASRRTA